jgi:hypothetical protein
VFYCLETLAALRHRRLRLRGRQSHVEAIIAKRSVFGKGGATYLVAVMPVTLSAVKGLGSCGFFVRQRRTQNDIE